METKVILKSRTSDCCWEDGYVECRVEHNKRFNWFSVEFNGKTLKIYRSKDSAIKKFKELNIKHNLTEMTEQELKESENE